MQWANLTLPAERGWFAVLLDIATWCRAEEPDSLIEWRVDGEGMATQSSWALTSFTYVDTRNESATAIGAGLAYGGTLRWIRAGVSAAGVPVGAGVENPLAPDLGMDDDAMMRTGGRCVDFGAEKIGRATGQRPDAFLFTFARESPAHVRWNVTLHLPTRGVWVGSGPMEDQVVYYEDQMPRLAGAYATGAAASYGTELQAELGAPDGVTALVFMPGNEVGAGYGASLERTNASMTPPHGRTVWFGEEDGVAVDAAFGRGEWDFTIEAKARLQHNDPVIFGATVPLERLAAFPV